MKSIINHAEAKQKQALEVAQALGFFRKRNHDKQLETAERVIKAADLFCEPLELVSWLIESKPTKNAKAAEPEPEAPIMTGSSYALDTQMQVLEQELTRPVIVTSAQNNTQPVPAFYQLKALAESLGAELIVLPVYYNKKSLHKGVASADENFHSDIRPYLLESDSWLFKRHGVRLCSQAGVIPTNKLPVNAAADFNSGEAVTIVGSPKQQMQCLPILANQTPRQAWTTGSVTGFNYIRGRAGSTAEKQHKYGGLLLTAGDSGEVNVTNLVQADNGTFISYLGDQFVHVDTDNSVNYLDKSPNAIKLGDLHCEMYDPTQWQIALDLVLNLDPDFVAVDDVLHFSTRSHHNRHDSLHLYATRNESVQNDLAQVIKQLNELAGVAESVYITESNHNSALDHWIRDSGVKISNDSHNAKLYHLINWLVMDTIDSAENECNLALEIALKNSDLTTLEALAENIEFGRMDVPKIGFKADFSQHGHKGQNGSAANPRLLEKWNLPLVTGHTHQMSIYGDVFTTGVTASKKQGYNRGGASSWQHGHVIEHCNGTCQMYCTDTLFL